MKSDPNLIHPGSDPDFIFPEEGSDMPTEPMRVDNYTWVRIEAYNQLEAATIERCAQELETAHAECSTLSLLHGAARIRALKDEGLPTAQDVRGILKDEG